MAIILRSVKGSNLTPTEIDGNFSQLLARIVAIETVPPEAVSIDSFTVVGNQLTVIMTDATTRGPFTLPTATWTPAGEWTPATVYLAYNTISNGGNLYLVLLNHTSEATFDPSEDQGSGFLYARILSPPIQPNDLHVFVGGLMSDAQLILRTTSTRPWILPTDLVGSAFESGFPAVDLTIIDLKQNATVIGQLTWALGATVPTIVFAADITFALGDKFSIVGPAIADTGLADISFDLFGNRI